MKDFVTSEERMCDFCAKRMKVERKLKWLTKKLRKRKYRSNGRSVCTGPSKDLSATPNTADKSNKSEKNVPTVNYTEAQAAMYINMSRSFLRIARMNGHLRRKASAPVHSQNGRTIRYLKADLDAWLQSRRVVQMPVDTLLD